MVRQRLYDRAGQLLPSQHRKHGRLLLDPPETLLGQQPTKALAMARAEGFECYAISFAYGQRHRVELDAAEMIARKFAVLEHRIVPIDLSAFGGSALTDNAIDIPEACEVSGDTIPITYVPARNTVFLSLALAWSEVLGVRDIFMGVNAVDYSGYP
ncbi:MAG: 7-cyano-7-deazaguanine synthase, partial [Acidobacteria bacterium]|nr:7-cyano-7-deazaguanine synthase [Acidobacteriota bacterium]